MKVMKRKMAHKKRVERRTTNENFDDSLQDEDNPTGAAVDEGTPKTKNRDPQKEQVKGKDAGKKGKHKKK